MSVDVVFMLIQLAGGAHVPRYRNATSRADAHQGVITTNLKVCLQSIFDALLRISRIETGAHPLRVTRPDMAKLIADAVDLYSPVAEQKGIRIEVQVEDVDIAGDADLLAQGICNLIDNAIKYSPEGGDIAIDLATADDGAAVLAITDGGPGFDPELANRLTERFFRGANAAHTDGFGLGLALVAAVAHAHKSTLGFVNMQPGLRENGRGIFGHASGGIVPLRAA